MKANRVIIIKNDIKMKSISMKVVIGFILILLGSSINGQGDWELVYSESEEFIRDICFVPGEDGMWQTGWGITGYPESNIIKTTDGGDTWIEIEQEFTNLLASISFADEDTGFIATLKGGNPKGLIMKSVDGGETWFEVFSGEDESFDNIVFKDAQNGMVMGINSYYTRDGGTTWLESNTPENFWVNDYAGGDTYYGVNLNGEVGKTTDGGENWSIVHDMDVMLGGVGFVDEMTGIVGGDVSTIAVTHDGGETWNETQLGTGQRFAMGVGAFDQDIMYAACDIEEVWMTTDGGETWAEDAILDNQSFRVMEVLPTNVSFIAGSELGAGGTIWRKIDQMPLYAIFEASETYICDGSTVDFTDMSYYNVVEWEWTFEGGTPSSSTEQNPTVTYENGGVFDVTLTVTNVDGDDETLTETDLINVFETPLQPETPTGDENICTENTYTYTVPALDFAQTYEWELSPTEAGELTWSENEAYFEVAEDWTGEFTLRVMAGNFCGDGPWSELFTGTAYLTPDVFVLQGGGSYCEGGEGVELTLDGSQEGVDYELYLEGEPTAQVVPGTGGAISFGNQTEAGLYEAIGFTVSCETYMSEQIEVSINPLPTPAIEGLEMVCDFDVTDYETTDNAGSVYTWEVTGGTIIDGQGTYMVTIEWGEAGDGTVTVTEQDANGCEATSEAFEVFIDDCTDITENGLENQLNVYPNPVSSKLNIEIGGDMDERTNVEIFNHLGQLVFEQEIAVQGKNQTMQVGVSNLEKGLYIIRIQRKNETVISKRIIKN